MQLRAKKFGFQGKLFESGDRKFAIICVSGSEGGLFGAASIARAFCLRGISTLAVAYFKTNQTPRALCEISIEEIEHAILFLKQRGYARVGIYGFSKGAELALVSASLLPELSLVITASPACCVFEGFTSDKMPAGRSSWTWRGVSLPYVPMTGLNAELMREKKKHHSFGFTKEYDQWLDYELSAKNSIAVEQIAGPILMLSAKNDEMWPSERMGNLVMQRLQQHSFAYPSHHAVYDPASHLLAPIDIPFKFLFSAERRNPQACSSSRQAALSAAVSWVEAYR